MANMEVRLNQMDGIPATGNPGDDRHIHHNFCNTGGWMGSRTNPTLGRLFMLGISGFNSCWKTPVLRPADRSTHFLQPQKQPAKLCKHQIRGKAACPNSNGSPGFLGWFTTCCPLKEGSTATKLLPLFALFQWLTATLVLHAPQDREQSLP